MDKNRRAGKIWFKIDGRQYDAKGDFTVNPGYPKRDSIIGADGVHGYKETPQVAFIEGAITDSAEIDSKHIRSIANATITLELNNGKIWVLEDAWYANEGSMTTGEGEIPVRFESRHEAKEI